MFSIMTNLTTPGRRALLAAGVVAASATLTACGGPQFAEGDCVHLYQRLTDHKLGSADCQSTGFTLNMSDAVFVVTAVVDGTSGNCGRAEVTFSDEPDDVTYCLDFY